MREVVDEGEALQANGPLPQNAEERPTPMRCFTCSDPRPRT